MDLAAQLLVCLTAAGLCAGVVRRVPLPLPLVQTVAGTLLAWPLGMDLELDPHAFLLVMIPPLLFIDAWRIPKRDFRRSRAKILLMAFGLVAITVLGVGLLIDWLVPAIPLPVAFAIAAALSPTDAVAVAGMTGRVRVPPRLMTILQGEALFNDAAGLVAMRVAVGAMLTGAFSWGHAVGSFVLVAAGGVAVGVALTWLFARLLKVVLGSRDESEAGARILLLLVLPYAAYLAADHLGLSGIVAAAAGGMVANRFAIIDPHHRATRLQGVAAFHMIELALNGLVFVLLGLQLPLIVREWPTIALDAQLTHAELAADVALVIGALLAIRFAWVWVSLKLTIYRQRARGDVPVAPPLRLMVAMAVAGVRGAVSLAAALTLPLTLTDGSRFPAREVAIFVCAIVIVVWLVGASVGLPLLLRSVVCRPTTRSRRMRGSARSSPRPRSTRSRRCATSRRSPRRSRSPSCTSIARASRTTATSRMSGRRSAARSGSPACARSASGSPGSSRGTRSTRSSTGAASASSISWRSRTPRVASEADGSRGCRRRRRACR